MSKQGNHTHRNARAIVGRPSRAFFASAGSLALVLGLAACGENPFDASGEAGGQSAADEGQAPSFGEIQQDMFSAMLEADSVTITGEVQAGDADLDEYFTGLDEDAVGDLSISGALDGTASEMTFAAGDSSFSERAVDGEEYVQGEGYAQLLATELEDVAEVEEAFIAELIGEQWIQLDDAQGQVFSAEDFITTWQQELDNEDIAEMTAETETRDGQEVWVYSSDDGEFVVAAEGEPYLLELSDENSHYVFSQWNESQAPEAPEDVITLEEISQAIAEEQNGETADNGAADEDADQTDAETT
ncbi:hypothetical protein [Nesterenkonia flava]|uniref:Lipoprotein n=1 Tax=Nesterenkonia flava TaxID=469799 RepID=A0ABU1FQN3_9MICC|nr:hypothetical protein [Nesterenkonia flava]MDR5710967.1 hypothetical protein [Nesterenkonia flava]